MIISHLYTSIKDIDVHKWNSCFKDSVEDYNYLLALESSNIAGFTHLYFTVENNGEILAACPAFITTYSLNTMASKLIKQFIPSSLGIKLLCLSSCFSENCLLGFKPDLSYAQQIECLDILLKFFKQYAFERKINFLGIRDLSNPYYEQFKDILQANGFTLCKSLPSAVLPIKWRNLEEYLKSCSKVTRKEIKRKLKVSQEVEIVSKRELRDVIEELYQLYEDTEGRSEWHFGKLTKEYFTLLVEYSPKIFCNLYYVQGQLLAANLLLTNRDLLLDKFFCMSYSQGRQYNLYVLSWVHNLQYCIDNRIAIYQTGQTGYRNKQRFGCTFIDNYVGFYHRNKLINWLLKVVSPKLIAFDINKELNK